MRGDSSNRVTVCAAFLASVSNSSSSSSSVRRWRWLQYNLSNMSSRKRISEFLIVDIWPHLFIFSCKRRIHLKLLQCKGLKKKTYSPAVTSLCLSFCFWRGRPGFIFKGLVGCFPRPDCHCHQLTWSGRITPFVSTRSRICSPDRIPKVNNSHSNLLLNKKIRTHIKQEQWKLSGYNLLYHSPIWLRSLHPAQFLVPWVVFLVS